MFINAALVLFGLWGLHLTWTRRHQSGRERYFDLVDKGRHPRLWMFTVGIRLLIWGLCVLVGGIRLMLGLTD